MLRAFAIATAARCGRIGSVENLILNPLNSVQIDCTRDMSTSILVVEPAVNNSVGCDLRIVEA